MKGRLHHIEIYVADLKKSLDFWGWLLPELGYKPFQLWDGGQSFILDDTYIVFVQAEKRFLDIPYHRCRPGLNHLAFQADSREFVDEMTRKLKDRCVTILYEDKYPFAGGEDCYGVYFEDPDRMKVEITAD